MLSSQALNICVYILVCCANSHYENIPMHNAKILKGYKNDPFYMKKSYIFLIFA